MPELLQASIPGFLAAILAAIVGVLIELHSHGERLARLETSVASLLSGHRVVDYGSGS